MRGYFAQMAMDIPILAVIFDRTTLNNPQLSCIVYGR